MNVSNQQKCLFIVYLVQQWQQFPELPLRQGPQKHHWNICQRCIYNSHHQRSRVGSPFGRSVWWSAGCAGSTASWRRISARWSSPAAPAAGDISGNSGPGRPLRSPRIRRTVAPLPADASSVHPSFPELIHDLSRNITSRVIDLRITFPFSWIISRANSIFRPKFWSLSGLQVLWYDLSVS